MWCTYISQWSSYQYVCAFQHSLNLTGCGIYIYSWLCVIHPLQNHVVSCDCVNNVFHTLIDLHLVMYLIWRRNIDFQRRFKECIVKCDTSTVFCKCRFFSKFKWTAGGNLYLYEVNTFNQWIEHLNLVQYNVYIFILT